MATELFREFEATWWENIKTRAWKKTCLDIEMGPKQYGVGILVLVGVAAIDLVFRGWDEMRGDLLPGLYGLIVLLGLSASWWAINVVLVSKDVYDENQTKIAALESALAATRNVTVGLIGVEAKGMVGDVSVGIPAGGLALSGHAPTAQAPSLADQLIQLRIDGVKVRNERIGVDGFKPWLGLVKAWEERAKAVLRMAHQSGRTITLADRARFETLDKGIPPAHWAHAISSDHNNQLRYLSRRIDILLEIMSTL